MSARDDETIPADLLEVEARLFAVRSQELEMDDAQTNRLMSRARRDVALRDVMTFSFAHLLTTILTLVGSLCHTGVNRTNTRDLTRES